jgi:holo-[acyl-carrier protein] synthase
MLYSGVDLIEIGRVAAALDRHADRLLRRVFTAREIAQCNGRAESFAVRFAAKEAAAKALGTGICRNGIGWTDIEVIRDDQTGAPTLAFHGGAQDRVAALGWREWTVSLSHDRTHAIALVVATS